MLIGLIIATYIISYFLLRYCYIKLDPDPDFLFFFFIPFINVILFVSFLLSEIDLEVWDKIIRKILFIKNEDKK